MSLEDTLKVYIEWTFTLTVHLPSKSHQSVTHDIFESLKKCLNRLWWVQVLDGCMSLEHAPCHITRYIAHGAHPSTNIDNIYEHKHYRDHWSARLMLWAPSLRILDLSGFELKHRNLFQLDAAQIHNLFKAALFFARTFKSAITARQPIYAFSPRFCFCPASPHPS